MTSEKAFDTDGQSHARLSSKLIEQYQKFDKDELIRRAANPEATPISREIARKELDRRAACKEAVDSGIATSDPAEPVRRGEATPIALLTLAVMALWTVALFWYEPKYGALMATATATGFTFVFPNAGRMIGFGLVAISAWLLFEIFTKMPLYMALVLWLIPLTSLGIGLNMVAVSFKNE